MSSLGKYGKVWTVSNGLSIFRALLAVPFGIALYNEYIITAIVIGIVAVITDLLDGYLARLLNQISEMGKILDPVADKICIATITIIFYLQSKIPLWLLLVVVGRDVLIMLGGLFAAKRINTVIPSNYLGKATVITITLTYLFVAFRFSELSDIFFYISATMIILSFSYYLCGMLKKIKS